MNHEVVPSDIQRYSRELEIPHLSTLGRLALGYGMIQANHLRPAIADRQQLATLTKAVNGPTDNPHCEVDYRAGDAAIQMLHTFGTAQGIRFDVHVEEHHKWIRAGEQSDQAPLFLGVIDPVDNTKTIGICLDQSTMMAIFDQQGNMLAASVASLNDPRIMVIDGGQMLAFMYDERHIVLRQTPVREYPFRPQFLRVATLNKRKPALLESSLYKHFPHMHIAEGLGGTQLLDTALSLTGVPNDVLWDGFGQPWYELAGAMAQAIGMPVIDTNGQIVDFRKIIRTVYRDQTEEYRVPQLICRNEEVRQHLHPLDSLDA